LPNNIKIMGWKKWRKLFVELGQQLDEIAGRGPQDNSGEERTRSQTAMASQAPGFEFNVQDKEISLHYQNLSAITINYFLMDIELLFSRNPFVQEFSGQFAAIRPNKRQLIRLSDKEASQQLHLPDEYHSSNMLIEIEGAGLKKAQPFFANALQVQISENYGQLQVSQAQSNEPLAQVYVKVYARMNNNDIRFYKDGYTDPRGRFDYSSLSTNELDNVDKFALLILSAKDGAVVREAAPPKQ